MEVRHPGFKSYYVRVAFDRYSGFTFDPHYLEIPAGIVATITWFTDNPGMEFTGFVWCDQSDHCSQHPLIRGNCMVGSAHAVVQGGEDVYWKYQVKAIVVEDGRIKHVESNPCSMTTDGLPAIHPN